MLYYNSVAKELKRVGQRLARILALRRFTGPTNAFSKKLATLKTAVALHFAYYNFCRERRTLRVTPAMQGGLESRNSQ